MTDFGAAPRVAHRDGRGRARRRRSRSPSPLFGASFGILARDAGMGIVAPIVMSLTTFAGSAQFAVASVLETGGAVAAAIVAAVLLNLRYLAIGVSVAPALRGSPARRLAEAQLAVDESWAVAQRDGRVDRDRLLGAGLLLMVPGRRHRGRRARRQRARRPGRLRARRDVPRALPRPARRPARRAARARAAASPAA